MDPIWEQIFATHEWGRYPPEHVIRFVARNFYKVPKRDDIRILDVGCGPGANLWYIAREGFTAYGIEGSPSAVAKAEERLAAEGLTAKVVAGDFCNGVSFGRETFDAAIDNFSICSNPRAACERAIANVHAALKPGGKFLTCWFGKKTWGYGMGREVEPNGFIPSEGPLANRGFSLFVDESDLRRLLSQFTVDSTDRIEWTIGGAGTLEMLVATVTRR